VNGPEEAGLRWHFGTENCKMQCKQTIFTKGKINDAFAEQFVASKEKGRCHCRDKDTKRDRLPPHGVLRRCGKADCWEYYRNVMSKVVALPTANFWKADQECAPCEGIECDETHLEKSFGGDDLREMKIQALADTTGKKQKELDVIITALRDQGLDVSERIITTTVKDEFRWTTVEPLTCSKHCADENGPGMEVGQYVCEKLSSSGSWERVEDDDCLETEGPMPALEVCATNVCRAADIKPESTSEVTCKSACPTRSWLICQGQRWNRFYGGRPDNCGCCWRVGVEATLPRNTDKSEMSA
jgi:hypothetical protein